MVVFGTLGTLSFFIVEWNTNYTRYRAGYEKIWLKLDSLQQFDDKCDTAEVDSDEIIFE